MQQNAEPIRAERLVRVDLDLSRRRQLFSNARHGVTFSFFGTTMRANLNDPAAAAALARRYSAFTTDAGPALDVFAVREDDRAWLAVDDGPAYRWDGALHSRGLEFLTDCVAGEAYFSNRTPYESFHSAAVAVDGRVAVAVTAASEGGKTTTALACVRRGLPLYSDEWCVLDGNVVQPFPRAINVRPGSLALLASEMPDHPLTRRAAAQGGTKWRDVSFEEAFGTPALPPPLPLAAIFFITGRADMPEISPLDAGSALTRLMAAPFRSGRRERRLPRAIALLAKVRTFGLMLGSPDATAQAIAACARSLPAIEGYA